eukprot:TRINITY_DN10688_c0_g1_i1.p1 TRINITY_DN10688_c0_g1~~TRINITY_DN10688_c0_g1_i1.p1  ORF type:complete len:285 (+),score=40.17 TRINITY_DN10688_c0_g1_i1:3-857(+)
MEWCEAGSIKDIMKITQKPLSEKQVAEVCSQVLMGLVYLHSMNLIHRDIKAANILLNYKREVKLGDFGLSEHLSNLVNRRDDLSGSLFWLAPEILKDRLYSEKSDIWALSTTVIEMLENLSPYQSITKQKKFSSEVRDFISACKTINVEKRPDAVTLLKYPFITKTRQRKDTLNELIEVSQRTKAKKLKEDLATTTTNKSESNSLAKTSSKPNLISEGSNSSEAMSSSIVIRTIVKQELEKFKFETIEKFMTEIQTLKAKNEELFEQNTVLEARVKELESRFRE